MADHSVAASNLEEASLLSDFQKLVEKGNTAASSFYEHHRVERPPLLTCSLGEYATGQQDSPLGPEIPPTFGSHRFDAPPRDRDAYRSMSTQVYAFRGHNSWLSRNVYSVATGGGPILSHKPRWRQHIDGPWRTLPEELRNLFEAYSTESVRLDSRLRELHGEPTMLRQFERERAWVQVAMATKIFAEIETLEAASYDVIQCLRGADGSLSVGPATLQGFVSASGRLVKMLETRRGKYGPLTNRVRKAAFDVSHALALGVLKPDLERRVRAFKDTLNKPLEDDLILSRSFLTTQPQDPSAADSEGIATVSSNLQLISRGLRTQLRNDARTLAASAEAIRRLPRRPV